MKLNRKIQTMPKHRIYELLLASFFVALLFASCKAGQDYERQEMDFEHSFRQDFPKDSSISNMPWWHLFKDTVLAGGTCVKKTVAKKMLGEGATSLFER